MLLSLTDLGGECRDSQFSDIVKPEDVRQSWWASSLTQEGNPAFCTLLSFSTCKFNPCGTHSNSRGRSSDAEMPGHCQQDEGWGSEKVSWQVIQEGPGGLLWHLVHLAPPRRESLSDAEEQQRRGWDGVKTVGDLQYNTLIRIVILDFSQLK